MFEKFIQAGGGYLGIHSATDCEYNWSWQGKLAGAYFLSHPDPKKVLNGKFYVVDKNHSSTKGMPADSNAVMSVISLSKSILPSTC